MYQEKSKKVLYIIGMEFDLDRLHRTNTELHAENMLVIRSFGPVISQPYGDLMRDIIVAVYQENVEEIYVVGTKDSANKKLDSHHLLEKIHEQHGEPEKIQTIDYLFTNCRPEFPEGSITRWLEGSHDISEGIQKSVHTIRQHSLIPAYVKVHGLFMDTENEAVMN